MEIMQLRLKSHLETGKVSRIYFCVNSDVQSTSNVRGAQQFSLLNHPLHHQPQPLLLVIVSCQLFPRARRNCKKPHTRQRFFPCSQTDCSRPQPTGIRNGNPGRVLVSRPLPDLEGNRNRNGAHGADDDGPEVRRALARGPLQVPQGPGPEPRIGRHRGGCGAALAGGVGRDIVWKSSVLTQLMV